MKITKELLLSIGYVFTDGLYENRFQLADGEHVIALRENESGFDLYYDSHHPSYGVNSLNDIYRVIYNQGYSKGMQHKIYEIKKVLML